MPDPSRDLASLFLSALDVSDAEARRALLDRECVDHPELREQVEVLLATHKQASGFLSRPPAEFGETIISGSNEDPAPAGSTSVLNSLLPGSTVSRILLNDPTEDDEPIVRPASPEIPQTNPDSRYQLQGEIARGGMGAILKGRDIDLGRNLAVKVLLDAHRNKPEVIQRFIEEAQIGGQLQHPGIVPVYELGQFADRRPFFSMKLVKGDTLAAMLAVRSEPSDDRGRLLGIFEQVCQTMAYAHSRGVVHRDLKPANVMVGSFGEVQVMDWGLAKVLSSGGIADEKKSLSVHQDKSIIQTLRSVGSDIPGLGSTGSGGSETQVGSVMGTPAYMPPEQALGEVDRLDERADVFGLGAILCEILTGKPPYVHESSTEVFRMASRGKLTACHERLDKCGADDDLIDVARQCLAVEPVDRPVNADALATRISSYLESVETRLQQSELDRIEANTKATEERKRRKVSMALAASVMLTFFVMGSGWFWLQQQQKQLISSINDELSTARALRGDPDKGVMPDPESLTRALDATKHALSLVDNGTVDDEVANKVSSMLTTLNDQVRDQTLIADLEHAWEWEMEQLAESSNDQADRRPEELLPESHSSVNTSENPTRAAGDRSELSPADEAQPLTAVQAMPLYEKAFTKWGIDPAKTTTAEAVSRIQSLPEPLRPPVVVSLERWHRLMMGPRTLEQWQSAEWSVLDVADFSNKGGASHEILADGSILLSHEAAKGGGYRATLTTDLTEVAAIRIEALPHASLPGGGPGWTQNHGGFYVSELRLDAIDQPDSQRRIPFRSVVSDYYAHSEPATTDLWSVVFGYGKPQTAYFEMSKVMHRESGFRFALSMNGGTLGHFRVSVCGGEADSERHNWLKTVVAESDDDPWRSAMKDEIARSDIDALLRRAEETESLDQQPAIIRMHLAETLRQIAEAGTSDDADLSSKTRMAAAAMLQRIHGQDEGDYWVNLALADSLATQNPSDLNGALRYATAAVALRPDNPMSHAALVRLIPLRDLEQDDPLRQLAYRHANRALELDPGNPAIHAIARQFMVSGWKRFIAEDYHNAMQDYRTALGLEPEYTQPRFCMAHVLVRQGKLDEAVAEYRRSIAIAPSPGAYGGLIRALRLQQKYHEAVELAKQCFRLHPTFISPYLQVAGMYEQQRQFKKQAETMRKAIDVAPSNASVNVALGTALINQGNPADAIEYFERALELDPNARTYNNIAWQLVAAPDGAPHVPQEAVEFASKAVELEPENYSFVNTLGVAHYRAGNWQMALDTLTRSVELKKAKSKQVGLGVDWFFMAMAHWKMGQKDKARELHNKAAKWMDADEAYKKNDELAAFRAEAETLLGIRTVKPSISTEEGTEARAPAADTTDQ